MSTRTKSIPERLVRLRTNRFIGKLAGFGLKVLGIEIPSAVKIGSNLHLAHGAVGLVVHASTSIRNNVTLYQGVTLGRANVWDDAAGDAWQGGGVIVHDEVIVGAGAKVLFHSGSTVTIGAGAVIGANAIVTRDVGRGEIWAGSPARMIRIRPGYGA